MLLYEKIQLKPLKDGKFMLSYFDNIVERRIRKIFQTLQDAKNYHNDLEYKNSNDGKLPIREKNILELVGMYFKEGKATKFNRSRLIFFEFQDTFGEFKAKDISTEMMEIFFDQLEKDHNYVKTTMQHKRSLLLPFINFLKDKGAIEEDIMATRIYHTPLDERIKRKIILSPSEIKKLLIEIKKYSPGLFYPMVLFAAETGAKRNEILTLKWGDVDLNKGVVSIPESKSYLPRKLKLSHEMLKLLKELPKRSSQLVFPTFEGKPFNKNKLTVLCKHINQKIDFDKRWTFPSLRNSYAYQFLKNEGSRQEMIYRLGLHDAQGIRELNYIIKSENPKNFEII
jgi:integrase